MKNLELYELHNDNECDDCIEERNRGSAKRTLSAESLMKRKERIAEDKKKNPEKYKRYYEKSRANRLANDPEKYLAQNAENQRKYRENIDPEVRKAIYKQNYNKQTNKYRMYRTSAENKGFVMNLTFEEATGLFNEPCFYCGIKENNVTNGIDRVSPFDDYHLDNCVSCCSICNNMKGSLDILTFMKICKTINAKIDGTQDIFRNAFKNYKSEPYNGYKKRARKE